MGMAVFALSSLGWALSPTTGALIVARCVQGVGAALAVLASLSLGWTIPSRTGGTALVSGLGWRSVFFLTCRLTLRVSLLPPGICPPCHAGRMAPTSPGSSSGSRLSPRSSSAGASGWASPVVATGLVVFAVAGAAFMTTEHRASRPKLPLPRFSSSTFSAATVIDLLIILGF
ncbi:MAG: hypothetical protein M0Z40_17880 [Actinomycetota bacterium]|nr:hypothetical protein [Actinomycetota bacterium]